MWELGFAMALAKPTIVLTESGSELPFDIKDMQRIEYRRHHLSSTLGAPLQRMVIDTLACVAVNRSDAETLRDDNAELVGVLLKEMAQFKEIVAEAVHAWRNKESPIVPSASELESLCGHWLSLESRSHIYASVVRGELVAPYCFGGVTNSPASTSVGGVQATIGSLDTNGCKPLSPASRFSGATLSTL